MTLKDLLERSSLKAIGLRLGLDVRMVDGHLHIWLATGGLNEVQVNKFLPLRHYRVILFPDTDPEGRAYLPQRPFFDCRIFVTSKADRFTATCGSNFSHVH